MSQPLPLRAAALIATLSATGALAQDDVPIETPDKSWRLTLEPEARYFFDADLDDAGSMSLTQAGISASFNTELTASLLGQVQLFGEYARYDFDDVDGLLDDALTLEIRPSIVKYFRPDLRVFAGVMIGAAGDVDADVGDSLYYGGYIGAAYEVAPKVWIGLGVGAQTQLEDDPQYLPVVTLNWDITDRLTLTADGLGGTLTYDLDNTWSLFLDGRYENRQYRLADDAPVPEGVLDDEAAVLAIGVNYQVEDRLTLSAAAGMTIWRDLEVRDEDEQEVFSSEVDPAAFVGLSARWEF